MRSKGLGYYVDKNDLQNGATTYTACVRYKGIYGGTKTFQKRNDAIQWANSETSKIDHGEGGKADIGQAEKMTFTEAMDIYLASPFAQAKKGKVEESYKAVVVNRAPFAKMTLLKIKPKDIREYRDKRLEKVSSATVRADMTLVSVVYKYMISEHDMTGITNPVDVIKKPKKSKPRSRVLFEGEREAILEAARNKPVWMAAIFEFLMVTGMRLGETCSFSAEDVNLDKRLIWLEDNKTDDPRHIPLTTEARDILAAFKPHWGTETVFGVKASTVKQRWQNLKKELFKAGKIQSDLRLHDFRHHAVTEYFKLRDSRGRQIMTPFHVQLVTGHKSLDMLARYAELKGEDLVQDFP